MQPFWGCGLVGGLPGIRLISPNLVQMIDSFALWRDVLGIKRVHRIHAGIAQDGTVSAPIAHLLDGLKAANNFGAVTYWNWNLAPMLNDDGT